MNGSAGSEGRAGVTLRPIGSPMALGFLGLAAATFVVSGEELGWIADGERREVGLVLLAVPFVLQLVTSVLAFLARDGAAATALGVQAATWGAIGLVFVVSPSGTSTALGLLLLTSGAHSTMSGIVTAMSKLVPGVVIVVTGVRFGLTGIHQLSDVEGWESAAGVVGLVLAGLAVYAATAMEVEDAQGRTVLPIMRRGPGERALSGELATQVEDVDREAGVRRRL